MQKITIAKALEIVDLNLMRVGTRLPTDVRASIQLCKEALERHRDKDSLTYSGMLMPLPSEEWVKPR